MERNNFDKGTGTIGLDVVAKAGDSGGQIVLMSAVSLAEQLDVSVRTVWRLLSSGKIPDPVKVGGSVRWRSSDISAWIRQGCPERQQAGRVKGLSRAGGHV